MDKSISVLIVEDSEDDAALLVREIRRRGYDPVFERVETRESMEEALKKLKWDAIICDYVLPEFSMANALETVQKSGLDIPFILVSGNIGEEIAVDAIKAGVHDYIMKDRLARLVPALEREICEAGKRYQVKQIENAIQALIKSMVGVTGQDFFDKIVRSMCEWLGADFAFIGLIEEGYNVKSLSVHLNGKTIHDCNITLSGPICETFIKEGPPIYTEVANKLNFRDCKHYKEIKYGTCVGVPLRDKNSNIIGIFLVASQSILNFPQQTAEVIDIIAAKAGPEIERMHAEKKMSASLREKTVLLKEIHHRVKNNLQIISSLLNLQSKNIEDNQMLSILRESQGRVKSMALIHEELYQSEDMAKIDFAEYVQNLINNLFRSFGVKSNIMTKIIIDGVKLSVDTAIPCGLIINELITNSLKYAFPTLTAYTKERGEIKVSLRRVEDFNTPDLIYETSNQKSKFELIVGDNGVGFPENIDFRNTKSLGLQLVNILTGQLKGTVDLYRNAGTEFKIMFEV